MIRGRATRLCPPALLLVLLSACAADDAGLDTEAATAGGPVKTRVVDATGLQGDVPSVTVRRQGRLLQVQFYLAAGNAQRVIVTSRNGRGLDSADARSAYDAAFEAAQQIDCGGGRPVLVDPDSATFQEGDRRSALTQGAPAWIFRGRCG